MNRPILSAKKRRAAPGARVPRASGPMTNCPAFGCENRIPIVYAGQPGASVSRFHPGLLICSACGVKEAFNGKLLLKKTYRRVGV